ncbi:DMT family transporter [Methylobacterium sp. J-068]|uniref:DMT family transporter n=1 Tax=Methylobacterium sp. J-068 TaxID=2836649 RepID=UPI001FB9989A|nr:DMT family transporter [Methylobacterium sp. J-068]MCJ2032931.1 DMT family transporter [Methylobacterium sp. J-068]
MWLLYGLALLAGIANAVQSGTNATLSKSLDQPFAAAIVVSLVGGATLLVVGLILGRFALPNMGAIRSVPPWAWFGGAMGALLILSQLFVAQRIGAAPYLGLLITAGVITSIVLDHFGWVGFERHPVSLWRVLGGLLMAGGIALVAMF